MITEKQIQYDFVEQIKQFAKIDKRLALMHHIPNGSQFARRRMHLAKMGCLSGVPDFFLPVAREPFHGFYLELKSKQGRLTDRQEEFAYNVGKLGYAYAIARSVDAALDLTLTYVGLQWVKE